MVEVMTEKGHFLSAFERIEKDLANSGKPSTQRMRKAAIARFRELGFPTPRHEDWKFTNVAALARIPFEYVDRRPRWRTDGALPRGVIVTSLAEALREQPDRVEPHLGRYADCRDHPFAALNAAFLQDGVFVYVSKGVAVDRPIYVDYALAAVGKALVWHPRCLIVAERDSQVRVVESYTGTNGEVYFTNGVTEIVLGENAVVDHYKVQEEGNGAYHVALLQVQQNRGSRFASHSIALGGLLVRNQVNAVLDAEGCECTLNGLYQADGKQHVDNLTVIDHAKAHCTSHELYKGILKGKGHGVFNGKIFVRQDAQKTDAKQTNQALLLSPDATINTKPQLEIFADEVKCTHGATVGQLDDEAVFYLRSRGLSLEEARGLLTYAFANDILNRIQVEPLRERLEQVLLSVQQPTRVPPTKERP
jgi:Fe-S cluster assembly protein SufD